MKTSRRRLTARTFRSKLLWVDIPGYTGAMSDAHEALLILADALRRHGLMDENVSVRPSRRLPLLDVFAAGRDAIFVLYDAMWAMRRIEKELERVDIIIQAAEIRGDVQEQRIYEEVRHALAQVARDKPVLTRAYVADARWTIKHPQEARRRRITALPPVKPQTDDNDNDNDNGGDEDSNG